MGVAILGVVVRKYIDFLILLIPTPLVSVLFCTSIPTFCSCFSFLFQYFFVITFYVLIIFSRSINTHTGNYSTGVPPRQPYEGCTYCFTHEEAHTNVRFTSCYGHQLYERGVDLEVEGVRYIEMHRGPAAYVLGPPPSRGRSFFSFFYILVKRIQCNTELCVMEIIRVFYSNNIYKYKKII